jgi:hypothetical protein
MLLDRSGAIRVQRTQNVAPRTAIGEGMDGRIWIFVTRGGYTLWEFALLLGSGPCPLRQALSMDGGDEAQMLVDLPGFRYDSTEGPPEAELKEGELTSWRRPLPTVIAVFPRPADSGGPAPRSVP